MREQGYVQVIELLRELLANISSSDQFVLPLQFEALKSARRRAGARAGNRDLRFHNLRYKPTSKISENGLNVMEVAGITGHKDHRLLQKYTYLRATGPPLIFGFQLYPDSSHDRKIH
tara:strand:- start:2310 stop:2660 length:351 start_codon:yes stop_codon:yes gene_type:complete